MQLALFPMTFSQWQKHEGPRCQVQKNENDFVSSADLHQSHYCKHIGKIFDTEQQFIWLMNVILCEKCPNMEFFLVRIFPHSDWIRRDTEYLYVFSPNKRKYGPEKTPYLDMVRNNFNMLVASFTFDVNPSRPYCTLAI